MQSHEIKSLADSKSDIETKLRPELARQQVDALRKDVTVQLDDSFFGPPAPVAPASRPAPTLGAPSPAVR